MGSDDDYGILVHSFDKSNSKRICIHVQEYKNTVFLSIREFYKDRASQEWRPSPRGVTVQPELYAELLQGVVGAAEILGVDVPPT